MPTIDMLHNMETPRSLRSISPQTSIGDVARGTGISVSHVSRIFNGRRMPRLDTAQKIANYLQVTVDQLMAAINEGLASPDPRKLAA